MAKVSSLFAVALLLSSALFAAPTGTAPRCNELTFLDTLALPQPLQSAALPPSGLAGMHPKSTAGACENVTASCGGTTVSCSLTGTSGECSFADRACPGEPGHVTCGTTTTQCPPCACTNGTLRWTTLTGCCCNDAGQRRGRLLVEQCVNGDWVYSRVECEGANCGGTCPK